MPHTFTSAVSLIFSQFSFTTSQEAQEVYNIANPIWTSMLSQIPNSPTIVVKSPLLPHIASMKPKAARGVAGLPTKEEWDEILKGAKLQTFKVTYNSF